MDRRHFYGSVEYLGHYRRTTSRPPSRQRPRQKYDRTKRYCTYFPAKASFNDKWNFADDQSTWEFSAPVALTKSRSSSRTGSDTTCSSPAQEIIIRYRAGLPQDHASNSGSSSGSSYSSETLPTSSTSSYKEPPRQRERPSADVDEEPKAKFRQSRYDALANTRAEAYSVMKQLGLTENDRLICQRPGCRDTVQNVNALMYHLHIHDIDDKIIACKHHNPCFESIHRLNMHCSAKSPPVSPLREGFSRILHKIRRL